MPVLMFKGGESLARLGGESINNALTGGKLATIFLLQMVATVPLAMVGYEPNFDNREITSKAPSVLDAVITSPPLVVIYALAAIVCTVVLGVSLALGIGCMALGAALIIASPLEIAAKAVASLFGFGPEPSTPVTSCATKEPLSASTIFNFRYSGYNVMYEVNKNENSLYVKSFVIGKEENAFEQDLPDVFIVPKDRMKCIKNIINNHDRLDSGEKEALLQRLYVK